MMKLGTVVIGYSIMAIIIHCLFIAYVVIEADTDCVPDDRSQSISHIDYTVAYFLAWAVLYFPFLLLCAFYIAILKVVRSFCCCCWKCCGHEVDGKGATKCKICMDGVFGNPVIFAVGYTLWGIYEWTTFSDCGTHLNYGFGLDVVLIAFSLLLLCIWYFVRTQRQYSAKRKEHIARKYNAQLEANGVAMGPGGGGRADLYHEGDGNQQQVAGRQILQSEGSPAMPQGVQARSYSDQSAVGGGSMRNAHGPAFVAPAAPQYAQSAHGVGPYRPGIDSVEFEPFFLWLFCR